MRAPSSNILGLRFGPQPGYPLHNGVHIGQDWLPGPDKTVYMPEDAIVTCVANNGNDGNAIYYYKNNYKVALCHLERFLVPSGKLVKAGTPVGIMGYTGYVQPAGPQGAHLHMAVMQNNNFIDPLSMIAGGKGGDDMADIFNEGDRKNLNDIFYGEDKGLHKEFTNGQYTYKQAVEKILGTPQFRAEQYVNAGDVPNIADRAQWPQEPSIVGWTWKRMWYDYAANKVAAGLPEAQVLNPGLYRIR